MNIEEIDKWLKEEEGISYTELGNEFNYAVEKYSKYAKETKEKDKEIERLNNIINELEKYFEQEGFWHSLDKIKELKGSDKE